MMVFFLRKLVSMTCALSYIMHKAFSYLKELQFSPDPVLNSRPTVVVLLRCAASTLRHHSVNW